MYYFEVFVHTFVYRGGGGGKSNNTNFTLSLFLVSAHVPTRYIRHNSFQYAILQWPFLLNWINFNPTQSI